MSRSDEHAYEALIRDSERILRDASAGGLAEPVEQEAAQGRHELASLAAAEAESADGYAEVRVSEDRMMAAASFHPAAGTGKQIELIEVREQLVARGLRFGIDWDLVKSAIQSLQRLAHGASRGGDCARPQAA